MKLAITFSRIGRIWFFVVVSVFCAAPSNADDRQRHKPASWYAREISAEKRAEEQRKKLAEEQERREKAERSRAEQKRWEEKRTELRNRYNAVDVKQVIERAKADFVVSTNRLAESPTPALVTHTNMMVKLTRQLFDAQQNAKICFNPNALLSQAETHVARYEKAHDALIAEMVSFSEPQPDEWEEEIPRVETVYPKRRTRIVFADPDPEPSVKNDQRPAEKLRELKALFDEGILTQDEYDAKRKAILETM